jgi:hypothetical protein
VDEKAVDPPIHQLPIHIFARPTAKNPVQQNIETVRIAGALKTADEGSKEVVLNIEVIMAGVKADDVRSSLPKGAGKGVRAIAHARRSVNDPFSRFRRSAVAGFTRQDTRDSRL